jgi:DNA-binding SARP family transcriptional activator
MVTQLARIQLFGGLRLALPSVTVTESDVPSKTAALVKLLALQHVHALHRDQLIDALWPGVDADRGANSLYKAIHRLRTALAEADARGLVAIRRKIVQLAPWTEVDLDLFKAEAEAATHTKNLEAYERALALSAGGLLPCDVYEDWTTAARAEAELLVQQLRLAAAEICIVENDATRAVMHLQLVLSTDPTNRRAQRMLSSQDLLMA